MKLIVLEKPKNALCARKTYMLTTSPTWVFLKQKDKSKWRMQTKWRVEWQKVGTVAQTEVAGQFALVNLNPLP